MKTSAIAGLLLTATLFSGCATTHAVRWIYGEPSTFHESDSESVDAVLKPALAVPMVVGGAAFDVLTFPVQALFGVWPWWGEESVHLVPSERAQGDL